MIPLLDRVDDNDWSIILAHSKKIEVAKGDTIYIEGETAHHFYIIDNGEVCIFKRISKDKEILLYNRYTDDGFGESGVFSSTYSDNAVATEKTTLCSINNKMLVEVLKHNGRIGLHFTRWLAESLDISQAKLRDYVAFGSKGAVASVFIRYSNMYGVVTKEGIRITKPIMLRDVSKYIGVSRETVSRIVSNWKERGIISNEGKIFLIKDTRYFHRLLGCENCAVENCVL